MYALKRCRRDVFSYSADDWKSICQVNKTWNAIKRSEWERERAIFFDARELSSSHTHRERHYWYISFKFSFVALAQSHFHAALSSISKTWEITNFLSEKKEEILRNDKKTNKHKTTQKMYVSLNNWPISCTQEMRNINLHSSCDLVPLNF